MSFTNFATVLALVLASAATGGAQTTWVVDAAGSPGSHFRDIQPAVDAARDGDVVRILPGGYTGFRAIGKGLVVAGAPGVRVGTPSLVRIESLAAHQRFVLADVELVGFSGSLLTSGVQSARGQVLLERVRVEASHTGFTFQDCDDARLSECTFASWLTFDGTRATLTDGLYTVASLVLSPPPALILRNGSAAFVSRCSVTGQSQLVRATAGPAAGVDAGCSLTITDDGHHVVAAGGGGPTPLSAILGSGRVVRDPRVRIFGANGAPPIAGPSDELRAIASLSVPGSRGGQPIEVDLLGTPSEPFLLVVGLPQLPLPLPVFGGSLDVGSFVVVHQGVFGTASERLSLPALNGLPVGFTLCWQAIAGDGHGGWQFSNAATYARTF